jgi:hypothetical protein
VEIIKPPNQIEIISSNHHKAAYKLMMTIGKEGDYIFSLTAVSMPYLDILTILGNRSISHSFVNQSGDYSNLFIMREKAPRLLENRSVDQATNQSSYQSINK